MKGSYCIGLDAHSGETEVAVLTPAGQVRGRQRVPTSVLQLRRVVSAVPQPRRVVLEESTIADWLWRNLLPVADEVVVCDPRRNRSISGGDEKCDRRDAEELARLLQGGYVQRVHHPESIERIIFKEHVGFYHDRVRQRVREANRIGAMLRRFGVMAREKDLADPDRRAELLKRLPDDGLMQASLELAWFGYDAVATQVQECRKRLVARCRQEEVLRRWVRVPGIHWVRAATLFVHLDTPWRFRSKAALWKYLGIGLRRRQSGASSGWLGVPRQVNRRLKATIIGAALSAVAGENPFAAQHRRWLENGLAPLLARRNVARRLACTLWGMWKNQTAYQSDWVGQATVRSG
jgi:transposase